MRYQVGQLIEDPIVFEDTDTGTPVDPTTLVVTLTDPAGTAVAYTYPAAELTKSSTGVYLFTFTPTLDGRYHWRIVATGNGQGTERRFADVDDTVIPASLTTVDAVREFLQTPTSDTLQDTVIESLIGRASAAIARYTEREFAPAGTQTRTFTSVNGFVSFAPYDLQSATTVTWASDSTVLTAGTSGYVLRPVPAADGVYHSMRLPGYPTGEGDVTVLGRWGWPSVPADVEHWCIVTTAIWLRKDVTAFSASLRLEEDRLERPDALPTAAARGLNRYRRPPGL